jgi:NAD+ synthase (glutamine-hydrolysing)
MRTLRLALAQMNATVGDLQGNTQHILQLMEQARGRKADLIAFPELAITGYPPEDLLFKRQFIHDAAACLDRIVAATGGLTVVVGVPHLDGGELYNGAAVAHDGKLVSVAHKMYLPTYGVFDEDRYFQAGRQCPVFMVNGVGVGVGICEDIWYAVGPIAVQAAAGAEVIVNINASPYHRGKGNFRQRMVQTRAADHEVYVAYVNMVGGQDELVFDGQSMVADHRGELLARGPQFEEHLMVMDLDAEAVLNTRLHAPRPRKVRESILREIGEAQVYHVSGWQPREPGPLLDGTVCEPMDPLAEVYTALVTGTRDYVRKSGHSKVVIGVSGGIDSALTAAVAVDALGKENVSAFFMPSRFTSDLSRRDAQALARNLGVELRTVSIDSTLDAYLNVLKPLFEGRQADVTEENIQARIRGNLLMAASNKFGWLVLNTGNKSEMATGYCTLYGDMAGGFAVLKDVPKTLVRQLAHYRNKAGTSPAIPDSTIARPPTAELRPNQKDEDSLPPYDLLDPILEAYVENDRSVEEMIGSGLPPTEVGRTVMLVDRSEYKRRQSPPGVKITHRAFGKDRRLPIVNRYQPR